MTFEETQTRDRRLPPRQGLSYSGVAATLLWASVERHRSKKTPPRPPAPAQLLGVGGRNEVVGVFTLVLAEDLGMKKGPDSRICETVARNLSRQRLGSW